jgi:hydroxymethylpyrimidine pyrophosphatase-like HAD family hydrolase
MAVLAIDWDNTLMTGDKWLPGAQEALKRLRELGHKVVINSCNNPSWIEKQLREAGIAVDYVWNDKGKVLADLYIDDKGYHFPHNSDWSDERLADVLLRLEGLDNRKW